jgi:hypothetical protein
MLDFLIAMIIPLKLVLLVMSCWFLLHWLLA